MTVQTRVRCGLCFLLAAILFGSLGQLVLAQGWRTSGPTMEWRCSKCRGLLGQGSVRPRTDKCPHCSARLLNLSGSSSGSSSSSSKPGKPTPLSTALMSPMVILLLLGVVGVAFKTITSARK